MEQLSLLSSQIPMQSIKSPPSFLYFYFKKQIPGNARFFVAGAALYLRYNKLQNPAAALLPCFALDDSVVTISGKTNVCFAAACFSADMV